jgi:hypothetical protein
MRHSGLGTIYKATLRILLGLTTSGWLNAQEALSMRELSAQQATLDAKTVTVKGILSSGHIGSFLKDADGQTAARLRFEALPPSAESKRATKDDLYRKLLILADSIPNPDQPDSKYEVELVGVVRTLKKPKYDVYKESPIEIYPLRVLRIVASKGGASGGPKVP